MTIGHRRSTGGRRVQWSVARQSWRGPSQDRTLAAVAASRPAAESGTLPVAATLYITDVGIQWGKLMALGVLIALPPLVVTLVTALHIIGGLTAGAVKG